MLARARSSLVEIRLHKAEPVNCGGSSAGHDRTVLEPPQYTGNPYYTGTSLYTGTGQSLDISRNFLQLILTVL